MTVLIQQLLDEYWHRVGIQEAQYAGIDLCQYTAPLVCQIYASTHLDRFGTQAVRYTGIDLCQYTAPLVCQI